MGSMTMKRALFWVSSKTTPGEEEDGRNRYTTTSDAPLGPDINMPNFERVIIASRPALQTPPQVADVHPAGHGTKKLIVVWLPALAEPRLWYDGQPTTEWIT